VGVKGLGREDVHSPPSSADVKECVELYLHSPNSPSRGDAQLKHRDHFTFNLTLPFTYFNHGYIKIKPACWHLYLNFIINKVGRWPHI
jgi:hypothetical protein